METTTEKPKYEAFEKSVDFKSKSVHISVDITFSNEGRLSLSGSVYKPNQFGTFRNVSAGQVQDQLIADFPKNKKAVCLYQIWERWHLNDMRAGCEHQRADWHPEEKITLYKFVMNYDTLKLQMELEKKAKAAAIKGETAVMSDREREILGAPYSFEHHNEHGHAEYYHLAISEVKIAGQTRPDEHPSGILTKPCEKCGYKYGSSWLFEEVPASVLAELRAMS